jgi:hypothetical protein
MDSSSKTLMECLDKIYQDRKNVCTSQKGECGHRRLGRGDVTLGHHSVGDTWGELKRPGKAWSVMDRGEQFHNSENGFTLALVDNLFRLIAGNPWRGRE